MNADTIQVKVSFQDQTASKCFPVSDAADDVRKWAIASFEGQIDDSSSVYTLFQIDPETSQASPVEGNFVDLKDLISDNINVLEFRLAKEIHVQGQQR